MITITICSLAGGQGKTTLSFFLGRLLAFKYRVLFLDLDPQANLTFYLGHEVDKQEPTSLELITGTAKPRDCIYESLRWPNVFLIPSDEGLAQGQEYLASSGLGAAMLKSRLKDITQEFDYCLIDSPPSRSQLAMTALGAANKVLIPVEAYTKGVNSLLRTLELYDILNQTIALMGSNVLPSLLGFVPFRDRWIGLQQTTKSREAIQVLQEIAFQRHTCLFPSMIESEKYKSALDFGLTLTEAGYPNLEYCFQQIEKALYESR